MHFASTPIRPEISNINLTTPPCAPKEETIAESVLHNTMQMLASEFKRTREPKIQKFRGGTSYRRFTHVQILDAGHRMCYKRPKP